MSRINRRQGLWLLAGGLVAAPAIGARAVTRAASPAAPGGTLALVEKGEGRVAFYALPNGAPIGTVALGKQPHEIVADRSGPAIMGSKAGRHQGLAAAICG